MNASEDEQDAVGARLEREYMALQLAVELEAKGVCPHDQYDEWVSPRGDKYWLETAGRPNLPNLPDVLRKHGHKRTGASRFGLPVYLPLESPEDEMVIVDVLPVDPDIRHSNP